MTIPITYQETLDTWADPVQRNASLEHFWSGALSFIPNLLPEIAVQLPVLEVLNILRGRFGEAIDLCLKAEYCEPNFPMEQLPAALRSPLMGQSDSTWLKRANVVGVNLRTIGGFWNVIPYTLTLPLAQRALHLLPVWEPGVVSSLYGMCSWELNPEFFSFELSLLFPWLNIPARQLRCVTNLLHACGRVVGLDVIPHTDRFSEQALAYPEYFEWLQRADTQIVDHSAGLVTKVQHCIYQFCCENGSAVASEDLPARCEEFFQPEMAEGRRLRLLFGEAEDYSGRMRRRLELIQHLYREGYETVPATMGPPFRGLQVDARPEACVVDERALVWRDFVIERPQPMSRVFNPLARYRFYHSLDDNRNWELDFNAPNIPAWNYLCGKMAQMQRWFGFDFMRGDMSHVQMRPEGVPEEIDRFYDPLGAVKRTIQEENRVPYFAYFAESFLAPPGVMAYGDEMDHLEASQADVTLGDLQSSVLGSEEFMRRLIQIMDLAAQRRCTPSLTVITADKDDPRFDSYYLRGNETRLFLALFLPDFPSYMSLGFETRDPHFQPAPNDHYTKLYVFHELKGPKATHGPYVWGKNSALFSNIQRMRLCLEQLWPAIASQSPRWLLRPVDEKDSRVLAWVVEGEGSAWLFVANLDAEHPSQEVGLPKNTREIVQLLFSTHLPIVSEGAPSSYSTCLPGLRAGESRIYRLSKGLERENE